MLVYVFRTFPYISRLQEKFENVIIVEKPRRDSEKVMSELLKSKPEFALGVAQMKYSVSQFEKVAINKFHKRGLVVSGAPDNYELFIPAGDIGDFRIAPRPSQTFCNYVMFRVSNFIDSQNLGTKNMFVHISNRKKRVGDLDQLFSIVRNLCLSN